MSVTCEAITLREKTFYWKEDASGNLAPPKEIGNNLCPNKCSGNGVCSNGKCICGSDFITADCSLKKGNFFRNVSEKNKVKRTFSAQKQIVYFNFLKTINF